MVIGIRLGRVFRHGAAHRLAHTLASVTVNRGLLAMRVVLDRAAKRVPRYRPQLLERKTATLKPLYFAFDQLPRMRHLPGREGRIIRWGVLVEALTALSLVQNGLAEIDTFFAYVDVRAGDQPSPSVGGPAERTPELGTRRACCLHGSNGANDGRVVGGPGSPVTLKVPGRL